MTQLLSSQGHWGGSYACLETLAIWAGKSPRVCKTKEDIPSHETEVLTRNPQDITISQKVRNNHHNHQ